MGTTLNEITGEVNSSFTLVTNEEVFDEEVIIRNDILPSSVTGTQITVSPTPPSNPQINDLWIDSSYKPELWGEARWNAMKPIIEWKPEVMA